MNATLSLPLFKRNAVWIPAAIVLSVVLIAGARLVELSMAHHAAQEREIAQTVVDRHGRAIEAQLQALADKARHPSGLPGRNTFQIAGDGSVLASDTSSGSDPATRQGIATEWATVDARRGSAAAGMLGPVRLGSQWIIAARAPLAVSAADRAEQRAAWSVAYQPLDRLLADARLGELARADYDLELSQLDPASRQPRIFMSSRTAPLDEPVTDAIPWPAAMVKGSSAAGLTLAIRPRAGWYPLGRLAASVGLLLAVTWLLTLAAYDVTRSSRGLRAALAVEKRRLHAANQRLVSEIERRQKLQKTFDHARYHDAFTGLPNRLYFMDQLDRALREARTRRGYRIAVILVDIDRFKLINDTLGQTAGDELMLQVARRFEKTELPLERVLARWAGDQFAVLLFDVHSSAAAMEIARLLQDALRESFELRRLRLGVAARMGITCIESGLQRAEEVLREADIALSAAKARESAGVVAYQPAMGGNVVSLVRLEADLQMALERNQLKLLFQPMVNLRTRRIVGAEVLLRWQHPTEGLLRPDRFLGIAEETGPIVPITRWIVARACRIAGEWRRLLPQRPDFFLSVNLSAAALRDPGLGDYVAGVLRDTRTPAAALRFELTEGGLIGEVGAAREILNRLHALGIRLTLDDFGTGHSSLNYLQLFPFDDLKIDRPLLERELNPDGAQGPNGGIIQAILQMAASLGLTAIAEKVETPAALQALVQMGCEFGQGYLFGAPIDAEGLLDRLMSQELGTAATIVAEPISEDAVKNLQEDDSPTLILPAPPDSH